MQYIQLKIPACMEIKKKKKNQDFGKKYNFIFINGSSLNI